MPITLAHPAAVLPLRRLGLPVSALVAGSMIPDIPVFLGGWGLYGVTHSWWGVLTADAIAAVIVLALWFALVRDAVVDLSPDPVRDRLPTRARLDRRSWLLAPPAAALGAATHVLWDAFTHAGAPGVERVPWLREQHLGLAGHAWAQYTSGVVGMAIVLVAAMIHLRRQPLRPASPPRVLPAVTLPDAVAVSLIAGLVAVAAWAPDLHLMAFYGVVVAILVGVFLVVVLAAVWHLRRPRDRHFPRR